jgi:hypothetical protein
MSALGGEAGVDTGAMAMPDPAPPDWSNHAPDRY